MLCSIAAVEEIETIGEAKDKAKEMARKYPDGGGFVIYRVEEIGRYETCAPVWVEASEPAVPAQPVPFADDGITSVAVLPDSGRRHR